MSNEEYKKFTRKRHRRGSGSVYRKPGSPNWVIQYYKFDSDKSRSVRVREYTKLRSRAAAQKLLTDRLSRIGRGEQFEVGRPVTVVELYDALRTFTQNNSASKRALPGLGWRWKHLKPFFGDMRAANVSTAAVEKYKQQRRTELAAPATINRELATLRRAFNYGKRCTPPKVFAVPYIQMFRENNARQGFVEELEVDRMRQEAALDGLWMRVFIELAYTYGWRRGELIGLRVRQVDLRNLTIRLDPGTTKNGEGREVRMSSEVETLLRAAVDGKQSEDLVITRAGGKPVKDFRGAWRNLCVRAGVGHWTCEECNGSLTAAKCKSRGEHKYVGLIPHDFRRSAAKTMRRAGIAESVIMKAGGWKTRSMFDRYAIVSSADQRAAMDLLEAQRMRDRTALAVSPPTGPHAQETDVTMARAKAPTLQ